VHCNFLAPRAEEKQQPFFYSALWNHELWPIVNGSENAPDVTIDPAAYDEWCLMDQEAQLMILLAFKKVGQKWVFHVMTSKEHCDCLSSASMHYSGSSGQRTVSLLEQVSQAAFTDTEPLQPQLDIVIFATHQLKSTNIVILVSSSSTSLCFAFPSHTLCSELLPVNSSLHFLNISMS